jgi:hypothetical protein
LLPSPRAELRSRADQPPRAPRYFLEAGYSGALYPINPNREVVQGLPAYPDLAADCGTRRTRDRGPSKVGGS